MPNPKNNHSAAKEIVEITIAENIWFLFQSFLEENDGQAADKASPQSQHAVPCFVW